MQQIPDGLTSAWDMLTKLQATYCLDIGSSIEKAAAILTIDSDPVSPHAKFLTRSSFSASILADIDLTVLSAMTCVPVKTLQNYASGRRCRNREPQLRSPLRFNKLRRKVST